MKMQRREMLAAMAALPWMARALDAAAKAPKVVLIAGKPSHGPGDHEFNAGITLLDKCLKRCGLVDPVVVRPAVKVAWELVVLAKCK